MNNTINMLVPHYLIHSYLYYECDTSIITDHEFNHICKQLLDNYNKIEHMHKHLISIENLKANTGYDIIYPNIVKHAAALMYNARTGRKLGT